MQTTKLNPTNESLNKYFNQIRYINYNFLKKIDFVYKIVVQKVQKH